MREIPKTIAFEESFPALGYSGHRRRDFLLGAVAVAYGLSRGAASAQPSHSFVPLGELAARKEIGFGFALDPRMLISDAAYAAFVARQATIVVPENALKWQSVHPEPDRYDFSGGDAIAGFAVAHGVRMRGHTFCWHRSLPSWVEQVVTRTNAQGILVEHIARVAGHYRGRIQSWDVANEVIASEDGLAGAWRNSFWYRMLGPAFMDIAYHAAHEADPGAVLCHNDYGLEPDGERGEAKRKVVLGMIRDLRRRGVPVGALGIQSHLRAGGADGFGPGLARFIREIHDLGLAVYITELDVDDSRLDPAQADSAVADVYKRYLDLVLSSGAVSEVLNWGVCDHPHSTAATGDHQSPAVVMVDQSASLVPLVPLAALAA